MTSLTSTTATTPEYDAYTSAAERACLRSFFEILVMHNIVSWTDDEVSEQDRRWLIPTGDTAYELSAAWSKWVGHARQLASSRWPNPPLKLFRKADYQAEIPDLRLARMVTEAAILTGEAIAARLYDQWHGTQAEMD